MFSVMQKGVGQTRDLVVMYFVAIGNPKIKAGLWPDACVLTTSRTDNLRPPPTIDAIKRVAYSLAGTFDVRSVTIIGYSAGCVGPREHLRRGDRPDVVVAIDGTHGQAGTVYPTEPYLAPWRDLADRAKAGECLFIGTNTQLLYTEKLPPTQRFPATRTVMRAATGFVIGDGGSLKAPDVIREGDCISLSYAGADKQAHMDQQNVALPAILADYVHPYLKHRFSSVHDVPPPRPSQGSNISRGMRALAWALKHEGHAESPLGSNRSTLIDSWLALCMRDYNRDGIIQASEKLPLRGTEWCAAFACASERESRLPGESELHPCFASGIELEQWAMAKDAWIRAEDAIAGKAKPEPGDIVILARGTGWQRHVCRLIKWYIDGTYETVGGNEDHKVKLTTRSVGDGKLIGFYAYPRLSGKADEVVPPELLATSTERQMAADYVRMARDFMLGGGLRDLPG